MICREIEIQVYNPNIQSLWSAPHPLPQPHHSHCLGRQPISYSGHLLLPPKLGSALSFLLEPGTVQRYLCLKSGALVHWAVNKNLAIHRERYCTAITPGAL